MVGVAAALLVMVGVAAMDQGFGQVRIQVSYYMWVSLYCSCIGAATGGMLGYMFGNRG